jgi:hypothetical protein
VRLGKEKEPVKAQDANQFIGKHLIYSAVARNEKQFVKECEAVAAIVLLFAVIQLIRRRKIVSSRIRGRSETRFAIMNRQSGG